MVWSGHEDCDDGNQSDKDACLHDCKKNVCGDGIVDASKEGCDDADDDDNDGCADCRMGAVAIGMGPTAEHVCAVRDGQLRCWGRNDLGQLGQGNTANFGDEADEMPGVDVKVNDPGTRVVKVTTTEQFTCVLLDNKRVRCWGTDGFGQLGAGTIFTIWGDNPGEMPSPIASLGGDASDVLAGKQHACALLTTDAVRCWGSNTLGQLGYPGKPGGEKPASYGDVSLGGQATAIAVGSNHSCALLVDGSVRCWGTNSSGQLGYPGVAKVGDDETPAAQGAVDIGGAAIQIAAGDSHTCVVLDGGTDARCWGAGGDGRLGTKAKLDVGDDEAPAVAGTVKMLTPGDSVVRLALGRYHTCALLSGGGVRCWGFGSGGALGYENTMSSGGNVNDAPAALVDVGGVARDVVLGSFSTCALLDGGAVRCWGDNTNGQLGVNSTTKVGTQDGTMPPADARLYANPP